MSNFAKLQLQSFISVFMLSFPGSLIVNKVKNLEIAPFYLFPRTKRVVFFFLTDDNNHVFPATVC